MIHAARARRAVGAILALSLLMLGVQRHHHASLRDDASCVACHVHSQRAMPAAEPVKLEPPTLVALETQEPQQEEPEQQQLPIPRAQGPPRV
jgi:hypothetical protein